MTKRYEYLLFDLDGTLTDSAPGITNSAAYALEKCGIQPPEHSKLNVFVGPPLIDSFMRYCDFTREQALVAMGYYREYYATKGIFENSVYDGVEPLLKRLKDAGRTLILATSKPSTFARQVIEHYSLDGYFDFLAGATLDEKRTKKSEVIEYALRHCGVQDKSLTVMIGDREYDIIGAIEAGVDPIGVLYGYGTREELRNAGAKRFASTPEALGSMLLD